MAVAAGARPAPPSLSDLSRLGAGAGDEALLAPDRPAVGPPIGGVGPARQGFPGIPFSLAEMQEGAGCEPVLQPPQQVVGQGRLVIAQRSRVPFRRVHVVDGHEGGLAALGEAHVGGPDVGLHPVPQRQQGLPFLLRVRRRHPGDFRQSLHGHLVVELYFGLGGRARDRRRILRVRRAAQGDMPLAGQESRGGVEPDPAGARHEGLGPGMQVGEIGGGALGAFQGLLVRAQLDEVAGGETRGDAQMAQGLHQQPGRIAAGPGGLLQGLLAGLHPAFHADAVADVALDPLVEIHQEGRRVPGGAIDLGHPALEKGARLADFQVGGQGLALGRGIGEGEGLSRLLDEEVEGIDDGHVRDQAHLHLETGFGLGENHPGDEVPEGILLPIDEMARRADFQRIGGDRGAAMGGRPQADELGKQGDRTVIGIGREMAEGDPDGHAAEAAQGMGQRPGSDPCSEYWNP